MEMLQLIVIQQALLRYYGNAIWCIDHVTKENLICHNIKKLYFLQNFKNTNRKVEGKVDETKNIERSVTVGYNEIIP
jgi:hypothetical protein